MISIAIGFIIFIFIIKWFISEMKKSQNELDEALKLDISKNEIKPDLYSYNFPELLKQRYMKERCKIEEEYEKVQLALKDWFSIFAFCTRKEFYDFPSKEVDELWHMFILFTADYREFCNKYLGQFLDHVPLDNSNSARYNNLENLMRTFKAVKDKNDGLLFKIDDMFGIKNEYNYNFMTRIEQSYRRPAKYRSEDEARELYTYGLISYGDSKAIMPEKETSNYTSSTYYSSKGSNSSNSSKNTTDSSYSGSSCRSSCGSCGSCGSSCGSSSCGS